MPDKEVTKPSFFDNFVRTIGGLATLSRDPSRLESVLTRRGREGAAAEHAAALDALALKRQGFAVDREKLTQMQGVLEAAKTDKRLDTALQSALALVSGVEAGQFDLDKARNVKKFWEEKNFPDSQAAEFVTGREDRVADEKFKALSLATGLAERQFPEFYQGPGGVGDMRSRPTEFQSVVQRMLLEKFGLPQGEKVRDIPGPVTGPVIGPVIGPETFMDRSRAYSGRQESPPVSQKRPGQEVRGAIGRLGSETVRDVKNVFDTLMSTSPYKHGGPQLAPQRGGQIGFDNVLSPLRQQGVLGAISRLGSETFRDVKNAPSDMLNAFIKLMSISPYRKSAPQSAGQDEFLATDDPPSLDLVQKIISQLMSTDSPPAGGR